LLPVVEACELLGFATLGGGDLTLTPLGKQFAEADIQKRKDDFAKQILRIPVVHWIMQMLSVAEGRRLDRGVMLQALELDFNQQEAPQQLETAINWGRYAELFSFDDDSDHVFLGTSLEKVESGEADPTLHSIDYLPVARFTVSSETGG